MNIGRLAAALKSLTGNRAVGEKPLIGRVKETG